MIHAIKHSISLILMLFFTLAGNGFNVINYCCDTCAESGIIKVATHSCAELHDGHTSDCCANMHHHTNEQADIACSIVEHMNDGCHLLRINTETPTFHLTTTTESVQLSLLYSIVPDFSNLLTDFNYTGYNSLSPPPLLRSRNTGRIILTKISTLLI